MSHSPPSNVRTKSGSPHSARYSESHSCSNATLLALPQEIWDQIFELLPGQDLQSVSKDPRLRTILEIARSSMHRLEVHRAGMVEVSMAGSTPLAERSELLKAYRARWESLRWTRVAFLRSNGMPCPQFVGTTLVRVDFQRPIITYHNQLPFGGDDECVWNNYHRVQLNSRGIIVAISTSPRTNLLAILTEEWMENSW